MSNESPLKKCNLEKIESCKSQAELSDKLIKFSSLFTYMAHTIVVELLPN